MRDRIQEAEGRLEAVLANLRVFLGFPDKREALAAKLALEGVTPSEVEAVAKTVAGRSGPTALAKVLEDTEETKRRAADVKRCDAMAKQAEGPPAGQGHGDVHDITTQEDYPAHKQRMAYALAVADNKSPDFVASIMGVTVEKVHQWVEDERKLRQEQSDKRREPVKVRKDEPEAQELAKLSHEERVAKYKQEHAQASRDRLKLLVQEQESAETQKEQLRHGQNLAFFEGELKKRNANAKKQKGRKRRGS